MPKVKPKIHCFCENNKKVLLNAVIGNPNFLLDVARSFIEVAERLSDEQKDKLIKLIYEVEMPQK